MNRKILLSMIVAGSLAGAAQAGPDLDTSQPPDPQPAGGPTGDGEDWAGDGRTPVTEKDPLDDREGVERRLRGPQREPLTDKDPTDAVKNKGKGK